jgi:hypothetical protein
MTFIIGQTVRIIELDRVARILRIDGERALCRCIATRSEAWCELSGLKPEVSTWPPKGP